MKRIYGDEAIRMMNEGNREVKKVLVGTDPWWGEKYEEKVLYKVNGETYEETTDRDGWTVLVKVEG